MPGVQEGRKLNLTHISADEVLVNNDGTLAYMKAELGDKIYKVNNNPYVLIRFSDACTVTLSNDETDYVTAFYAWAAAIKASRLVKDGSAPQTPDKAAFICGVPVAEAMQYASSAVGASEMNNARLFPMAVTPTAISIPMRSNWLTYGPYKSTNWTSATGGANIEQNTDLAPWVFGSKNLMDAAGNAIAESYQIGLVQAETGSATIPGLPINTLPYMGTVANGAGPNLTGINVSFGSSGITTNYTFQTYTPKFGTLTRSTIDHLKNIAKNRQKQLQFLRNQAITAHNISRKLRTVRSIGGQGALEGIAKGQTLHNCLIGEIRDWYKQDNNKYSQRCIVGADTLSKSTLELRYNYEKKAFMSLDAFYSPVSKAGDGDLPRFVSYKNKDSQDINSKSSPIYPQPPFLVSDTCPNDIVMDEYNLDINQKYYDPLTNKITKDSHHYEGEGPGHCIELVGRGKEPPEKGMLMNMMAEDDEARYSDDYRFMGLRGPLVLHSWGYDLDGKPVPNASDVDTDTESGKFTTTNLKDKFLKNWLNKPKSWPVAPVDLRFDRERGMWVSPQPYKIVLAKVLKSIPAFGSGPAMVITDKDLYDKDGNIVKTMSEFTCDNSSNSTPTSDQWVLISVGSCQNTGNYFCYFNDNMDLECHQPNGPENRYNGLTPVGNGASSCAQLDCASPTTTGTPTTASPDCNISDSCINTIFDRIWAKIMENTTSCDDGGTTSGPTTEGPTTTAAPGWYCSPVEGGGGCIPASEGDSPTYPTKAECDAACNQSTTTTTSAATTTTTSGPTTAGPTSSSSKTPIIKVTDKLGRSHSVNDMIYAYYDTYKGEYIVLENGSSVSSPTVYGSLSGLTLTVEGTSGISKADTGSSILVANTLNLTIPSCSGTLKAVAMKFKTYS